MSCNDNLFISSMYAPEMCNTSYTYQWKFISVTLRLQFIGTAIEKPGDWMKQQSHSRWTVRKCVIICLRAKKYQLSLTSFDLHIALTSMYLTEESSRYRSLKERGRNIVKEYFLIPKPSAKRMKNHMPQGLLLKITQILLSKKAWYHCTCLLYTSPSPRDA